MKCLKSAIKAAEICGTLKERKKRIDLKLIYDFN